MLYVETSDRSEKKERKNERKSSW